MIVPSRRRFLLGAGALLAAPAIVRVSSLMPVSSRIEWIAPFHVSAQGADWSASTFGFFRNAQEAINQTVGWARDCNPALTVSCNRRGPFEMAFPSRDRAPA